MPADGGSGTPAPQKALRFSIGGVQHEIVSALTTTRDGRRELLLSMLPRTCARSRPDPRSRTTSDSTASAQRWRRWTEAPSFVFGDEKSGAVSIEAHGAYEHARADNDDALPVKIDP